MINKIVMISGKMYSGKDTAADFLVKNYNFKRFAFADILKDEVSAIFGINRELMDTVLGKKSIDAKTGCTVREILIAHGNQRRSMNENYWVDSIIDKVRSDGTKNIVISDFRFPNEFIQIRNAFHPLKIDTWRINRLLPTSACHLSVTETSLDSFDFSKEIENNGTILQLHEKITKFI